MTATSGTRSDTLGLTVVFAQASVDLAAALTGGKTMSGLLHGLNFRNEPIPPQALVAPLRPGLWRATPNVVPFTTAAAAGARYTYILSDVWGYPASGVWAKGRPWEVPIAYQALIREVLQPLQGQSVIAEVWNEPDSFFGQNYWDGTEAQFFEIYRRGFMVARATVGEGALIAGPSISRYDLAYLQRFADYCVANGCEVNVLTWHEMGFHRPLSTIADHVAEVRREIVTNPAYAALRVREVHINETVGPQETYNPAASLTYLRYLEIGGADAAARACWSDSTSGLSNCFNNSLDGLVTPGVGGWQARGVWWAYKAYADGQATRVPSTVSDSRMLSLASRAVAGSLDVPQVLIGYASVTEAGLPATAPLGILVTGLDAIPTLRGRLRVRVQIVEIDHTGERPLTSPTTRPARDLDVRQNGVAILVDAAKVNAVYVVRLEPIP